MTVANASGARVEAEKDGRASGRYDPIAEASEPQLRGLWARILILKGHKPSRAAKVNRSSVRQMYRDIESAEAIFSQLSGGNLFPT